MITTILMVNKIRGQNNELITKLSVNRTKISNS